MSEPAWLSARTNPTVQAARALQQRKGRAAQGLYLVEGVRLVADVLASGRLPTALFYDPASLPTTSEGSALLERLHALSGPTLYRVTPSVLAAITDTVHPAGVAALVPLPFAALPPPPSQPASLTLLLDAVQDPGNAGSMLRTAAASGVVDAVLTTPGTVDLFAPKVVRAAMGAHARLPLAVDCADSVLAAWIARYPQIVVAQARATTTIYQVDWRHPTLLIVGNEAHGPLSALRDTPTTLSARIPMAAATESLNVAAAAAIILFTAAATLNG